MFVAFYIRTLHRCYSLKQFHHLDKQVVKCNMHQCTISRPVSNVWPGLLVDSKFEYEESRLVKHRLQVHRAPQLLLVITHIFGKTKKMSGPLKTLKSFKKDLQHMTQTCGSTSQFPLPRMN